MAQIFFDWLISFHCYANFSGDFSKRSLHLRVQKKRLAPLWVKVLEHFSGRLISQSGQTLQKVFFAPFLVLIAIFFFPSFSCADMWS